MIMLYIINGPKSIRPSAGDGLQGKYGILNARMGVWLTKWRDPDVLEYAIQPE
jgi:hypothetical protein